MVELQGRVKKLIFLFIFLLCSQLLMGAAGEWQAYESDNFVLFYPEGYEKQALEALYYLEEYRDNIMELAGNRRNFKTIVVLQDIGLYSNAYAFPMKNKIGIFTTVPETDSELGTYENWFRMVGIHEYTHIAQMTNYSGPYILFNFLFGQYFLPNAYIPDWMVEGIAVYSESIRSPYEGRLNDGHYDAVVASKAAAGSLPSLIEITYRYNHYPAGHWYLYGGEFLAYLAETYGEDKFAEFFTRVGADSNIPSTGLLYPFLGIDRIARQVYGYTFPELFEQWKNHLKESYSDWKIEGEMLVENKKGRIFGLTYDSGNLYYFKERFLEPGPFESTIIIQLAEYNVKTGEERVLTQLNADVNPYLQVVDGIVYYAEKVVDRSYANVDYQGFGFTASLSSYDLRSRRKKDILKTDFKDFLVLPGGEILYTRVRRDGSGSEIWSLRQGEECLLGEVDEIIGELVYHQEGILVVSKAPTGSWNINLLNLEDLSLSPVVNSPYAEKLVKVQGEEIYFTANYGQGYSVYEYRTEGSGQVYKLMDNPYGRDGVAVGNDIFFVGLLPDGEAIYRTTRKERKIDLAKEREEGLYLPERTAIPGLRKAGFYGKNYSYLFKPDMIFPLLYGSDALELLTYTIDYLGLSYSITSQHLMPLSITLNGDLDSMELLLDYPLYRSSTNGLSGIDLSYRTDFEDKYPGIALTFSGPEDILGLKYVTNIEGSAYYQQLVYRHLFSKGSLRITGLNFVSYAPGERARDTDFFRYKDEGSKLSLDLMGKLAEIRGGLWNPNFYFGDLFANLFVDYNWHESEDELVYGGELQLEMAGQMRLQFVPVLGVKYHEEELKPYFEIQLNL
ncbi:MAG: hypothetical protein GX336_06680 [Halanaerobiaceae bacterium]|nr:hypothetical protein [Halanaerobiaceae bacterium]